MVQSYGNKVEKVTFNIPSELKELDKWQKGVTLALNDKEYMALTLALACNEVGDESIHRTVAKTLNPNYKLGKS